MAMSSIATTHCLVAGASMSPQDSVWSVAWSMRSEFELLTGDAYGQIRVWDIRRSGTIRTLDQYCTAPKVPQPSSSPSTKHARKQYRRRVLLPLSTLLQNPSHKQVSMNAEGRLLVTHGAIGNIHLQLG
eukprot:gene189-3976_t